MAKLYRSEKEALRVRTEACHMAAGILASEGGWDGDSSKARLWSLCVFFESFIAQGAKSTLKDFGPRKPKKAPVIQLITRD